MIKFKINPEFEEHLIPLSDSEFSHLTEQICHEGCRDPIVIWEGKNVIVDGHNRFKICTENEIEFDYIEQGFKSDSEVLEWIDRNQIARRNLSPADFKIVSGRIYNSKKAKTPVKTPKGQVAPLGNTAEKVADELGTSKDSIKRNGTRAEVHDKLLKAGEKEAAAKAKVASQKVIDEVKNESPKAAAAKLAKPGQALDSAEALVESAVRQYISPLVRITDKIATANGGRGKAWNTCNDSIDLVIGALEEMKAGVQ